MRRLARPLRICACLILLSHGENGLERPETHASLEEMVVERAWYGMSGSDAKNFKKLVKALVDPMRSEIKKKKTRSQSLLDKSVKVVTACTEDFATQLALAERATLKFGEQRKKHRACRTKQAELISSTEKCVDVAREKKEEVKLVKGVMKSMKRANKYKLNEKYCQKFGGEEHVTWLKRMRGNMKSMIRKVKSKKRRFLGMVKAGKKKGKGCKSALNKAKTQKKQCDKSGQKMDAYSCNAAVSVVRSCDKLDMCYPVALKAYKSLESTVRLEVNDYKVEWRAFDRIDCYLGALGKGKAGSSNKTHLEYCSKYAIDTAHLDVKFPRIPKQPSCPKPAVYPCTAAYVKAEYDTLPSKARGKCTICEAMKKVKK